MGWYIIMEPSTVKKEKNGYWPNVYWRFGEDWEEFEIAHLATSDGIGIELFSSTGQRSTRIQSFQWDFSFFCTRSNIEDLIEKIVSYGGKQRMPIRILSKIKPFKMCYVKILSELFSKYTHSYELTYSSGAIQIKIRSIESIGLF
jgi:hypothetical protein